MLINIKRISKTYRTKSAKIDVFSDLCFSAQRGDFVALRGASGCGKSTLLRILGCLDKHDSGTYHLDGLDTAKLKSDKLAGIRNAKIGFVFQDFNLIPEYTVAENIELPLGYGGTPSKERKRRVSELLDKVGLPDKRDMFPSQLSGGQQQRAAIARALSNSPMLILADEPTGNLDADNMNKIMTLFKEINDGGVTIIMVTHDENAASYANEIKEFSLLTLGGTIGGTLGGKWL